MNGEEEVDGAVGDQSSAEDGDRTDFKTGRIDTEEKTGTCLLDLEPINFICIIFEIMLWVNCYRWERVIALTRFYFLFVLRRLCGGEWDV